MRVEILEKELRARDRETGRLHVLTEGDIITVSDKAGTDWCTRGWARDVDGNCETGERVPGAVRVTPISTRHARKEG